MQDSYEYVLSGAPLEQITYAEPLASSGETVASPQAWQHLSKHNMCSGDDVGMGLVRLVALNAPIFTYRSISI